MCVACESYMLVLYDKVTNYFDIIIILHAQCKSPMQCGPMQCDPLVTVIIFIEINRFCMDKARSDFFLENNNKLYSVHLRI